MRFKFEPEIPITFPTSNLKLTRKYYEMYESVSRILNDTPEILDCVHEDLKDALKRSSVKDSDGRRFHYTSEMVLRVIICQALEGLSLRRTILRIDDSQHLRLFVRIYDGPVMDYTMLCRFRNAIDPATWKRVNELLTKAAVAQGWISGEALRLDTTLTETNIHRPSDSHQLWDVYRVLSRLIDDAREFDREVVGARRVHRRGAKRLYTKISRRASKQAEQTPAFKALYVKLVGMVEGICTWSIDVRDRLREGAETQRYGVIESAMAEAIATEIDRVHTLGLKVIDQTRRRMIQGETVPSAEKILSIFEPHTEVIIRGKAGKPVEFGHMIQIHQIQGKFITGYDVFKKKPIEHELLEPALEHHHELFGEYPQCLAADKGYYKNMEVIRELEEKIEVVGIAKKGKRTESETTREHRPMFKLAQGFRAGVEGTISFLKRVLGLTRCMTKGWEHYVATVGSTVFAHNLLILARL